VPESLCIGISSITVKFTGTNKKKNYRAV
jgi:hypothetical protein